MRQHTKHDGTRIRRQPANEFNRDDSRSALQPLPTARTGPKQYKAQLSHEHELCLQLQFERLAKSSTIPKKHFYASKRLRPFGKNTVPKRSAGFAQKRRKENKGVSDASNAVPESPPITIRRNSAKFGEV
jgi:hypothetical protein